MHMQSPCHAKPCSKSCQNWVMQQLLRANGQTQLQVALLETIQGNASWWETGDGDDGTH